MSESSESSASSASSAGPELVTVRFLRKAWEAAGYEASMSGDSVTDVINRAVGVYVQLRDAARVPGSVVAVLNDIELVRTPGKTPVVRLLPSSKAQLVTGLSPEEGT